MPIVDPSALTRFNPALFYELEPETDPRNNEDTGIKVSRYMQMYSSQQTDVFEALLYAQNELLPQLQSGFDTLTPEQLITWIKTIHEKSAKTICVLFDTTSGFYATQPIFRWEHGANLQYCIREYLSGSVSKKQLLNHMKVSEPDVSLENFEVFLAILTGLRDNPSINADHLIPSHILSSKHSAGTQALNKLFIAYHNDLLSSTEKTIVNQFVKICMPPEQYEAAMHAYAEKTIRQLNACNPHDVDAVSHTLAEVFYGLVNIHPFVNGNGRSTTVMMNLFLVAMGHPSILLRHPGEKSNPESAYSQAFKHIDTSRESLAALIKQRITTPAYHDELKCQTAVAKARATHALQATIQMHGEETVESAARLLNQVFSKDPKSSVVETRELDFANTISSSITESVMAILHRKNTESYNTKKVFIEKILKNIMPEHTWKIYKERAPLKLDAEKNPIALLESFDISQLTELQTRLSTHGLMTPKLMKRVLMPAEKAARNAIEAVDCIHVLQLDEFNYLQLLVKYSHALRQEPLAEMQQLHI